MNRRGFLLVGVLFLPLLTGCETARFYTQAIGGHWEVMTQRERVDRLLVREDTPDPLKAQLRLAGELLSFAERELELPARGQYRHYADLGRPHVVWNVFAAPEFSLEAKTWWYPVVGRLDYRGYFREALAEDYARRLARQGYDVHVGGVQAYSTLGWFRDPLLNTFVSLPEAELADLLFHELAHQRLFIPGDTECNEAFAVTVAREGVRRWLRGCGREVQLRDYEEERRREDAVTALMDAARERLEALYAGAANTDPAFLRQAKAAILEELRVEYAARRRAWPGDAGHEDWAMGPINNARLNAVAVYSHWVPLMERLLAGVGGSLPEFYRLMERLRDCRKEERREILRWFEVRTGQVSDWKSLNRGSTRR